MFLRRGIVVGALLASAVTSPSASADGSEFFSITAGPKWSNGSTVSNGRKLDCTDNNPYFPGACQLDLQTPSGCYYEVFATNGLEVERRVPSSDCSVRIQGSVQYRSLGGTKCVLTAVNSLLVEFRSRPPGTSLLTSTYFQASATLTPKSYYDPGRLYVRQMTVKVKGTGPTNTMGVGSILDTFVATFVYPLAPECPSHDEPSAIAVLRDTVADTVGSNPAVAGGLKVVYQTP